MVVGAPLLYRKNRGYFWEMEKVCLRFCMLPYDEPVIAILCPYCTPVHLVVPCGTAIASPGTAQQLWNIGSHAKWYSRLWSSIRGWSLGARPAGNPLANIILGTSRWFLLEIVIFCIRSKLNMEIQSCCVQESTSTVYVWVLSKGLVFTYTRKHWSKHLGKWWTVMLRDWI